MRERARSLVGLIVAALTLGVFTLSPVSAHFTQETKHLGNHAWKQVIKQKADQRYLKKDAVLVRSQPDPPGFQAHNSGTTQLNDLTITAPSAGFLIISGQAFLANSSASQKHMILVPRVDGLAVGSSDNNNAAAVYDSPATGNPGNEITLAYTIVHPVSRGTHVVSQDGGPISSGLWSSGMNELTALFIPRGGLAP